ncbi:uncharacterized protein LOC113140539 [Mastacembelus armatus]|uniref:uncharacterized protein LOC113140539 n=1 Tax=Mastacembelus armatus TaxID=205130 RepID=UPI000E455C54|nr:uncharacterized protein LOC113140539 [Mastacembelus armatus]
MNSLLNGNQTLNHCSRHFQSKAKNSRPRHLHQSTLNLGDTAPCYTTIHSQSYSGRSTDGRPLIFHLRDPSFPSQHHTCLDLSNSLTPLQFPLLSHTKEVHSPKHITPRVDLKVENWTRYHSGQTVRELTNPQNPSEYWTTYKTNHTPPGTGSLPQLASGTPTQWHQHDILTGSIYSAELYTSRNKKKFGEKKQAAGPGKPRRQSRDKLLWATRRWEMDYSALRLY